MIKGIKNSGLALLAVAATSLSLAGAAEAQSRNCQIEIREMPVGTSVRVRTTAAQSGSYSFSLRENVPGSEVLIDASGPFNLAPGSDRVLMTFIRHQAMIPGNFMNSRNAPARTHGHLIDYLGELRVYDRSGRQICRTNEVGIFNGRGEPFPQAQASQSSRPAVPTTRPNARPARRPLVRF